tara:strand:- start:375 stop:797 length:423 start_codon:yes stop_codon:yes gene_type:complete
MTVTIDQTDDITTCLEIRRKVFIDEQGVPEADEVDALDPKCLHLLATDAGAAVGTARVYMKDGTAKIGRVCVLPSHRGTGLGAALIRAALVAARQNGGIHQAKLGAQVHALGFYEKLGFTAVGPVFDDAGIDHRMMVAPL